MTGLFWAAALVLAAAGAAKMIRPEPTVRAATDSALPGSALLTHRWVVRLVGLVELSVAATAILAGGPRSAALLALTYGVLTIVAWRLMSDIQNPDCGCFGRRSQPVGRAHVVTDAAGAVVGMVAVVRPPPGLSEVVVESPWAAAVLGGTAIVLSWLAYLAMTALPALSRLRAKLAGTA